MLSGRGERDAVGAAGPPAQHPHARTRAAHRRALSGGNQQKCMIARSLNARCGILLIDEPTRGVDVGAKREIYQLLARLADEERRGDRHGLVRAAGNPRLSDRILVMRDGRIAGRFEPRRGERGDADAAAPSARRRRWRPERRGDEPGRGAERRWPTHAATPLGAALQAAADAARLRA